MNVIQKTVDIIQFIEISILVFIELEIPDETYGISVSVRQLKKTSSRSSKTFSVVEDLSLVGFSAIFFSATLYNYLVFSFMSAVPVLVHS